MVWRMKGKDQVGCQEKDISYQGRDSEWSNFKKGTKGGMSRMECQG